MTIDIEGLREFIEARDRSYPPYFAGRKDVIADIKTVCRTMWQRHTAGAPQDKGMTRIIHGAPGAGKTSLLGHLERQWGGSRTGTPPRLLRLVEDTVVSHAEAFHEALIRVVSPELAGKLYAQPGSRVSGGGVQVLGTGGHISVQRAPPMIRPRSLMDLSGLVERWDSPVVVAIDEAQNIGRINAAATAAILQGLHNNLNNLPVMLVLAGLGDTVDRAMELGLSRPAQGTTWTLGCFDEAESDDLIAGWGRHFGLPDGDWRNTMRGIAEDCDHWPVHVQNALMALADEVVAADGRLEDVQSSVLRARSRKRQLAYYRQRMSPEIEGSAYLVGAMMRDLEPARGVIGVDRLIRQHCIDESGWRLPDGMTVNEYFNHLIHRGALHKHLDTGTVECPIPSFRAWLIEQGEPPHENDPEPDSRPSPGF